MNKDVEKSVCTESTVVIEQLCRSWLSRHFIQHAYCREFSDDKYQVEVPKVSKIDHALLLDDESASLKISMNISETGDDAGYHRNRCLASIKKILIRDTSLPEKYWSDIITCWLVLRYLELHWQTRRRAFQIKYPGQTDAIQALMDNEPVLLPSLPLDWNDPLLSCQDIQQYCREISALNPELLHDFFSPLLFVDKTKNIPSLSDVQTELKALISIVSSFLEVLASKGCSQSAITQQLSLLIHDVNDSSNFSSLTETQKDYIHQEIIGDTEGTIVFGDSMTGSGFFAELLHHVNLDADNPDLAVYLGWNANKQHYLSTKASLLTGHIYIHSLAVSERMMSIVPECSRRNLVPSIVVADLTDIAEHSVKEQSKWQSDIRCEYGVSRAKGSVMNWLQLIRHCCNTLNRPAWILVKSSDLVRKGKDQHIRSRMLEQGELASVIDLGRLSLIQLRPTAQLTNKPSVSMTYCDTKAGDKLCVRDVSLDEMKEQLVSWLPRDYLDIETSATELMETRLKSLYRKRLTLQQQVCDLDLAIRQVYRPYLS